MVAGCQATPGCVAYVGISYLSAARSADGLGEAQLANTLGQYELPTPAVDQRRGGELRVRHAGQRDDLHGRRPGGGRLPDRQLRVRDREHQAAQRDHGARPQGVPALGHHHRELPRSTWARSDSSRCQARWCRSATRRSRRSASREGSGVMTLRSASPGLRGEPCRRPRAGRRVIAPAPPRGARPAVRLSLGGHAHPAAPAHDRPAAGLRWPGARSGAWTVIQHASAAQDVVSTSEPLSLSAQQMYRSLSDADVTATTAFLAGPDEPLPARQRYAGRHRPGRHRPEQR